MMDKIIMIKMCEMKFLTRYPCYWNGNGRTSKIS